MPDAGKILVRKPTSIWRREIRVDVASAVGAAAKGGAAALTGSVSGVSSASVDVVRALGLADDVGGLVWLLVMRGIRGAIAELLGRDPRLALDTATRSRAGDEIEGFMAEQEWPLDSAFLDHPAAATPVLAKVAKLFRDWTVLHGCPTDAADAAVRGFPGAFGAAVANEWFLNHRIYEPIRLALRHELAPLTRAEEAWRRYHLSLESQLDEPVFDESFTLRDIYVPLRAICVRDNYPDAHPYLADVGAELRDWAERKWRMDALRIISGEPGSGKSSVAKVFAAEWSRREDARVLFIPMHVFDFDASLEDAVEAHFKGHGEIPKLLEPKSNYVLVFDGLDELLLEDQNGPRIAIRFLTSLHKAALRWQSGSLLAVVSAREVLLQAIAGDLKRHQVLRLAPFHLDPAIELEDPAGLRTIDQRDVWWRRYGELKGRGYDRMPTALDRPELAEINVQPLLNYILALSYERGQVDFTAAPTINVIYRDLIEAVYDRAWGGGRHASLRGIRSLDDFERVLQEIALAAWDGNGRTTTMSAAVERCSRAGIEPMMRDFSAGVEDGVARLLTAFYFRYAQAEASDEHTFEFTHKSFSEYLLARAMVRVALKLATATAQAQRLAAWISVADVPFDEYAFRFLRNEVALLTADQRRMLRERLLPLLLQSILLDLPPGRGLPADLRTARRCGISLLAIVSAAAAEDREKIAVELPSGDDFGRWLTLMIGSHGDSAAAVVLESLASLSLPAVHMQGVDLGSGRVRDCDFTGARWTRDNLAVAVFSNCTLANTSWVHSHAVGADFRASDLTQATVQGGDWSDARFAGGTMIAARFFAARLARAHFREARCGTISFTECDLSHATFEGCPLEGARFVHCVLQRTSFAGAILDGAVFENCIGLEDAGFENASLSQTDFREADPKRFRLTEKQLQQLRPRQKFQDELDLSKHQ